MSQKVIFWPSLITLSVIYSSLFSLPRWKVGCKTAERQMGKPRMIFQNTFVHRFPQVVEQASRFNWEDALELTWRWPFFYTLSLCHSLPLYILYLSLSERPCNHFICYQSFPLFLPSQNARLFVERLLYWQPRVISSLWGNIARILRLLCMTLLDLYWFILNYFIKVLLQFLVCF